MAFAEVAGVAAIGPFMALVGDISLLHGEGVLAEIYSLSGFQNPRDFLFWLGVCVLVVLACASVIAMFTTWRLSLYAAKVGAEISTRLFKHYMSQPWLFHANGTSSELTNRISQETNRITNLVIQPLMQMNAKAVLGLVMGGAIFAFNPLVALVGLTTFSVAYVLLYKLIRSQLTRNGDDISKANQERFKLMNEGFGGIRDTLLLGRQTDFVNRFNKSSELLGNSQGVTRALAQAPRYAMELVAFGAVIFLILYLLSEYDGALSDILPVLSVYALAGFKLLPAFQQIYTSLAQVKGNMASFDSIEEDLKASLNEKTIENAAQYGKLKPRNLIELEDISFSYPGNRQMALQNLSLKLPVNQVIGLVGASGSGKSTTIDILLGLIEPKTGLLKVDGIEVKERRKRAWQNNIGFVPQTIFLADSSIRENIAFGIAPDRIDEERVRKAAKLAHLEDLLDQLDEGLDTRVGERGIQISGGQRQRIGIARALYDDADVLVFDEATSALDGITEKLVMDAIHNLSGAKTIVIIAHRINTVRQCDTIYFLNNGTVQDSGTYEQLVVSNNNFKKMAYTS
ncbi:ABC transporter ATP-binding protein [Idiomarina sp. 29L]|uniref:ABC transporter ATP-binding protein n=1 Tax=Idiomarina sp. 29L TaxID=2508877 RepID=UPI001F0C90DD|nr:ABC transporter ATP-binding protein [Idiomarina sp. 29L]